MLAAGTILAMNAAIAVHELGHLAAGMAAGFRWEIFKAGPIVLSRSPRSVDLSFGNDSRYRGRGLVATTLDATDRVRLRHTMMLLGGPLTSMGAGAAGVALWIGLGGGAPVPLAFGVFGVCSLVVLLTSLLPVTSSGHLSDGGKIRQLLAARRDDAIDSVEKRNA
jgi:hypothetical protein